MVDSKTSVGTDATLKSRLVMSDVMDSSSPRELAVREQLRRIDLSGQAEQHRLHRIAARVDHAEALKAALELLRGRVVHGDERGVGSRLDTLAVIEEVLR